MTQKNVILLAILSFFFFYSPLATQSAKFQNSTYEKSLPDNDLWVEDCLDCKITNGLDEQTFNKIIDTAMLAYKPLADANKEELIINKNWTDSTVNANCLRSQGTVEINMYGGLARRQEVNPEGFTLVLCHELSHAYGGTPYIQVSNKMSAEGQADYKATQDCAKKVFKILKIKTNKLDTTPFMLNACKNDTICLSSLVGGQALGNLLALLNEESVPNYETPDPTVVLKTLLSYPDTTQCRLDTYLAGATGKPRPPCWFKK